MVSEKVGELVERTDASMVAMSDETLDVLAVESLESQLADMTAFLLAVM